MNFVKMERLEMYRLNNENIGQSDSKFQLNRMQTLFIDSMRNLNNRVVLFSRSYELKLDAYQRIILVTDWNLAKTYFIE
jgi:hypothetical protein